MNGRWIRALVTTAFIAAAPAVVIAADDSVAAARDLYASAAYEDALALLNRLRASGQGAAETGTIEQYRAFCLLALGREAEAEDAIAAVIAATPSYHPSDADVSPRVRTAFTDVRRRMLPGIIQQKYAEAKAAYDRKAFAPAADQFRQVLAALRDPDVGAAANQPPLSDLRILATGFLELSAAAAAPTPPPPPAPAATPVRVEEPPPPRMPASMHIYSGMEGNVVPPITIRQVLPGFPGRIVGPMRGALEIVIGESGSVESAVIRQSVNNYYDTLAVAATKSWKYRPATVNGVPVKFRKVIQVALNP